MMLNKLTFLLFAVLTIVQSPSMLLAQQNGYKQTNLTANTSGVANQTDPQLVNPWGIAFLPGNPFWIANNRSGTSTLYDAQGNLQQLVVTIPSASVNPCSPGCPTGIVNNQVYVAYAMQDATKRRPVRGAGIGVVDVFDTNGNFVKTFATGGQLNAPWAVVATPASFGTFSNAILVGNFGDGTINAFDSTGKSLGQVTDSANNVITNPGLWDMVFGAGGTGDPNTLYFTAGGATLSSV